jgi:hypothetical protein
MAGNVQMLACDEILFSLSELLTVSSLRSPDEMETVAAVGRCWTATAVDAPVDVSIVALSSLARCRVTFAIHYKLHQRPMQRWDIQQRYMFAVSAQEINLPRHFLHLPVSIRPAVNCSGALYTDRSATFTIYSSSAILAQVLDCC